ncbi:M43 family zinc metalloprotease [Ornithobacterium rhinotracheale]|uniref:M43 family zinc metalloprotease n=1 Tax=Ornithobacterium rhinotracheale TaxID=28251 RepID=UPI001FF1123C|nr:M43 family zinc metalloprotease [Ornithobacterium rhinotracheale]MCK0203825.1 M43 family zinc metalloprotease [Ornithobacterium rhinotracheale]
MVKELWEEDDGDVTGVAIGIISNSLLIRRDKVLRSTSPHEVGHCLGLYHTFEQAFCKEKIDGSNCHKCGDKVCDTPPDIGKGRKYGYKPDMTNIMSYYPYRDHFTEGQFERMKKMIEFSPILRKLAIADCNKIEIVGESLLCNPEGVATYTIQNTDEEVEWSVEGAQIVSKNSNDIQIKPHKTQGEIILTAKFLNKEMSPITKEIWVGKPTGDYTFTPISGGARCMNLSLLVHTQCGI